MQGKAIAYLNMDIGVSGIPMINFKFIKLMQVMHERLLELESFRFKYWKNLNV